MGEIREIYCVIAGLGRLTVVGRPKANDQGPTTNDQRPTTGPPLARQLVPWYTGTQMSDDRIPVERVQTGVRMEKRLLKVLKAFAEYRDLTLGDLLEGIVLHAFDGKLPFSRASLDRIRELKKFYDLELDSRHSHRLQERVAKKFAIKRRPAR